MRRNSRARRRALMIETSDIRRQSSVRRLRRKVSLPSWLKNIPLRNATTWVLFGCAGMAFFVGIALLSPLFQLKTITVERTSPFADPVLVEQIMQEFKGDNMLFLRHADIIAALKAKMPELRDIEIVEDWPRSILVRVGAAQPLYNIFNTETANFSVISKDGIVLSNQSIEGLPVIKIRQREEPILLRERVLSPKQLEQIYTAEGIVDSDLRLPIESVEVLLSANELHIISRGEMAIWIDLSYSVKEQLEKLKMAEEKIKLYRDRFDHIDLRIPQQIFWEAL